MPNPALDPKFVNRRAVGQREYTRSGFTSLYVQLSLQGHADLPADVCFDTLAFYEWQWTNDKPFLTVRFEQNSLLQRKLMVTNTSVLYGSGEKDFMSATYHTVLSWFTK